MIKSIHPLLNTLEGERYVRRALLLEVIDELTVREGQSPATQAARTLLARMEKREITDADFVRSVAEVRSLLTPELPLAS